MNIRYSLPLFAFFYTSIATADITLINDTRSVYQWNSTDWGEHVNTPALSFSHWQRSDINTWESSLYSNFVSQFNTYNVQGGYQNTTPYVPGVSDSSQLGSAVQLVASSDWSTAWAVGVHETEKHLLGFTFSVENSASFSLLGTNEGNCSSYYCGTQSGYGITYSLTDLNSGQVLLSDNLNNLVKELGPIASYPIDQISFGVDSLALQPGNYAFAYSITNLGSGYLSGSYELSAEVIEAPATVPIPSALWMFGSGLIGLAGVTRKRKLV